MPRPRPARSALVLPLAILGASAIVRAEPPGTTGRPRVVIDTDAANDVDDQHALAYALAADLDILAIASVHHGGGQEARNQAEIVRVLGLARAGGLPADRNPKVVRGADRPLEVPESGAWADTEPIATEASAAILTAARGASPGRPVWVVALGPCTNVASAILQARTEGLGLADRLRIAWLGGSPAGVRDGCFNGRNDPWSAFVVGASGVPTTVVLENPTGASLRVDPKGTPGFYPDTPLGRYLASIVPPGETSLYDVALIALVVADSTGRPWLLEVEPAAILGPDDGYRWARSAGESPLRLVRAVDAKAMARDFIATLNGRP